MLVHESSGLRDPRDLVRSLLVPRVVRIESGERGQGAVRVWCGCGAADGMSVLS